MMDSMFGIILFVFTVVMSIFLSEKLKVNSGLIAIMFAFIIGILGGVKPSDTIKLFNGNLFGTILIVTSFYGFCVSNGSMPLLAQKLIYKTRRITWAMPFILGFITFIVSAAGAGGDGSPIIMSPICFALAMQLGFDPMMASIPIFFGSFAGWLVPWSWVYALVENVANANIDSASAGAIAMGYFVASILLTIVGILIPYLVTKSYRVKPAENMAEPPVFNKKQKISLVLVLIVMLMVTGGGLLGFIFPGNAIAAKVSAICDIRLVSSVGMLVATAMKLGDPKDVFKNRIPWGLLISLTGIMLLVSVTVQCGIVDYISQLISNSSLSGGTVVIIFYVIGFLLSCVASGLVTVYPLCAALSIPVANAIGVEAWRLIMAVLIGAHVSALSPYSTGGAMSLVGCPEEIRDSTLKKQLAWTFVEGVFMLVIFQISGLGDMLVRLFM